VIGAGFQRFGRREPGIAVNVWINFSYILIAETYHSTLARCHFLVRNGFARVKGYRPFTPCRFIPTPSGIDPVVPYDDFQARVPLFFS